MANRVLRDWTFSENINKLSPEAEVFFVRLIMKADDYGCFYGNTMILNSQLYPLKPQSEADLNMYINELEVNNVIMKYEIEEKQYLKILNFGQRLRTMKSRFPQPAVVCQQPAVNCPPETKRNEVETETEKETEVVRQPEIDINGFVINP